MARARIETLLSIDQWAEVLGFSPYWINQIETNVPTLREETCQNVFYQYSWQKNWIGREEVASAIAKAESMLAEYLNYHPAPKYIVQERIPYPRPNSKINPQNWYTKRFEWKPIHTEYQKINALGTLKRTEVEAGAAIVRSKRFGTVDDTFTVTVNTTEIQDESEAALYVQAADRWDNPIDETWRIRPVQVELNDTNSDGTFDQIIFRGHVAQVVNPILFEKPNPDVLDVNDTDIYLTALDVYKVETDTTDIGFAVWDSRSYRNQSIKDLGTTTVTNADAGVIRPEIQVAYSIGSAPDRLRLNYLSGVPLKNGKVNHIYAQLIAYLSITFLPALVCGCQRAEQILEYWKRVPSQDDPDARPLTPQEINENPFGASRAGRYVWARIFDLMQPFGNSTV